MWSIGIKNMINVWFSQLIQPLAELMTERVGTKGAVRKGSVSSEQARR